MVQDAATAKEHQVDARSRYLRRGRDDDERALSVRPLQGDRSRRRLSDHARVVRLAHGLPTQLSDMAASRLAVIDVRPERGEYATNLAKRGAPRLPSSMDATDGLLKLFQMIGVRCRQW